MNYRRSQDMSKRKEGNITLCLQMLKIWSNKNREIHERIDRIKRNGSVERISLEILKEHGNRFDYLERAGHTDNKTITNAAKLY